MTEEHWFVLKGRRCQGPFYVSEIKRFMIAGRINTDSDQVSQDRVIWEPITQVPQLIPEEMLHGCWIPEIDRGDE